MNKIGRVVLCACLIAWASAAGADVQKPAPVVLSIPQLIEDLGHPLYSVRENASRELWKRGKQAQAALAAAVRSQDAEVARRAKEILDKFEWGIYPDTSQEVLKLLKELRSNDLNQQRSAVRGLLKHGRAGWDVLRAVLSRSIPVDVSKEFAREDGSSTWRSLTEFVASQVRREALTRLVENKHDEADELLAFNTLGISSKGLADYAVYQYLRGTLPQAVAHVESQRKNGGPTGETAKFALVYLYRAQGEWKKARIMAADLPQVPNQPSMIEMLLEEEGAWAELAKRNPGRQANLPDGLRLTLFRLAGKTEEFEETAAEVAKSVDALTPLEDVNAAVYGLLLNQRAEDATKLLLERRTSLGLLSELLMAQMRYKEALELAANKKDVKDRELVEFNLRQARLLFLLGRRSDAIQLFGQVADTLRKNPENGQNNSGFEVRSLLRAEMRLGLRDVAFEHAATFLTADSRRFRDSFIGGESPFEILFDTDATAAEALFWAMRDQGNPQWGGPALKLVRELFRGTAPKDKVEAVVKLLQNEEELLRSQRGDVADGTSGTILVVMPKEQKVAYQMALAMVLRASKRWDEAEKAYSEAAALTAPSSNGPESRYSGARSWVYGTSDEFRPWMELGDFLMDRGRPAAAAKQFEAGWKQFPDQPVLLYLCGRALLKAGNEAEGRRRIELSHWVSLGNERIRGRFLEELIRRGAVKTAKRETELLLHACWSRDGYFGNVMNQAARASVLSKDFATAERCVQRSLMVILKMPGVHFIEPSSYLSVPQNMQAYRARALLAEGKVEEGMEQARAFLAIQPGHADFLIGMVMDLDAAGHRKEADELFGMGWKTITKMLADYPESTSARNASAWLAANCRRELDSALKYAEEAVKSDPKSVAYRETLAEVHFRRGDRTNALAIMKVLAEESPRSRLFRRQLDRYRTGDTASSIPETEPE